MKTPLFRRLNKNLIAKCSVQVGSNFISFALHFILNEWYSTCQWKFRKFTFFFWGGGGIGWGSTVYFSSRELKGFPKPFTLAHKNLWRESHTSPLYSNPGPQRTLSFIFICQLARVNFRPQSMYYSVSAYVNLLSTKSALPFTGLQCMKQCQVFKLIPYLEPEWMAQNK